jgi:hypothetical protein
VISGSIVAHKSRERWAIGLSCQLDFPITWDFEENEIDTHLRALKAHDPNATYHLTIEDDAIVSPHLLSALIDLIPAADNQPISLYYGQTRPYPLPTQEALTLADSYGANLIRAPGPLWGVAVAHPVSLLPAVIAGYESDIARTSDIRVFKTYGKMGIRTLYTIPSLVDHRVSPSLTYQRPKGVRVAYRYSDSPLDWSSPLIFNYDDEAKLPSGSPAKTEAKISFVHRVTGEKREVWGGSNIEKRMEGSKDWVRV